MIFHIQLNHLNRRIIGSMRVWNKLYIKINSQFLVKIEYKIK